jgi:hypothetical protein
VKWLAATVVVSVTLLSGPMVSGSAAHAAPPDTTPVDPNPTETTVVGVPDPVPAPTPAAGPLVVVPAGCAVPRPAAVVFVGLMLAKDSRTARFRLEQVRAGSADGYAVTDLIDVRFDDDVRFLSPNQQYLVGAAPLDGNLVLASKVRDSKPLFGGNAVVGVSDKTLECPALDDPVRALHLDGSAIESGVLHGLKGAKRDVLLAVVTPVVWAFAIIIVLVMFRWLLMAMLVMVRRAADGEQVAPARRARQHHNNVRAHRTR